MIEDLKGKKILVVTAHPDDESALAGGTIRMLVDSGSEVHLLCATKGEKGTSHLGRPCEPQEIKQIRSQELEKARQLAGIAHVRIYEFPDGQLGQYVDNLIRLIQDHIDFFRPDYVLGFGQDGYTGHLDHIAAFKAAFGASFKSGIPYMAFSLPPSPLKEQYLEKLNGLQLNGTYSEVSNSLPPDLVVQVDPKLKLEIMRCHQSQWEGLNPEKTFGKDLSEHFLTHEYFSEL
jgi:LmbE family N-acetylglucosaminyl deacetylase